MYRTSRFRFDEIAGRTASREITLSRLAFADARHVVTLREEPAILCEARLKKRNFGRVAVEREDLVRINVCEAPIMSKGEALHGRSYGYLAFNRPFLLVRESANQALMAVVNVDIDFSWFARGPLFFSRSIESLIVRMKRSSASMFFGHLYSGRDAEEVHNVIWTQIRTHTSHLTRSRTYLPHSASRLLREKIARR